MGPGVGEGEEGGVRDREREERGVLEGESERCLRRLWNFECLDEEGPGEGLRSLFNDEDLVGGDNAREATSSFLLGTDFAGGGG